MHGPEGLDYLKTSLQYYLHHPQKAKQIAQSGLKYTMTYHKAENRIEDMVALAQQHV